MASHDVASNICQALPPLRAHRLCLLQLRLDRLHARQPIDELLLQVPHALQTGSSKYCPPHHTMPFNLRHTKNEGSRCVSMTWRATSAMPHLRGAAGADDGGAQLLLQVRARRAPRRRRLTRLQPQPLLLRQAARQPLHIGAEPVEHELKGCLVSV